MTRTRASKSLPAALYSAYLMAFGANNSFANVFRVDMANGDQYFFATSTAAALVGHADARERLPKSTAKIAIRHLTLIATTHSKAAKAAT